MVIMEGVTTIIPLSLTAIRYFKDGRN